MEEDKKLTKNQKRRAKKKQKQDDVQEQDPPEQVEEEVKPQAPRKKGKRSKIAAIAKQAAVEAEEEEIRLKREQEEAEKKAEEDYRRRLEEEKRRLEEEAERKRIYAEQRERDRKAGIYKTQSQLEAMKREEEARKRFEEFGLLPGETKPAPTGLPTNKKPKKKKIPKSLLAPNVQEEESKVEPDENIDQTNIQSGEQDEEIFDNWEDMLNDEGETNQTEEIKQEEPMPKPKKKQKFERAEPVERPPELRSPIVCILGHVDTGKTKLLDKIRRTNVQLGEVGGITQQIGATMFPSDRINQLTQKLARYERLNIEVPGLLIIDTPGHESFTNLRSRGSSLCDLAILVVDLMHGLEQQTLESLDLLRKRNIPFVVALNKVDRLYEWSETPDEAFRVSLDKQQSNVKDQFRKLLNETVSAFAIHEVNAALYWENPDPVDFVNLVPTSAHTGEGIPDLLFHLVKMAQTNLRRRIKYREELQATVMEVKTIEGLGTTVDVILANGELREGSTVVLAGTQGPIVTNIRGLLTPQPLKEMRVKGDYVHHAKIHGAIGVKIIGQNLETAMAGSQVIVAGSEEEIVDACEQVQSDVMSVLKVNNSGIGVHVQASTIGSLEALLEFLKDSKIPVSSINIGPVHRKDVLRIQPQVERSNRREYASILAFDVKVAPEAAEYAAQAGVRIFTADIIYHLFDQFTEYCKKIRDEDKNADGKGKDAIFPCVLKIVHDGVFHMKSPIILGVEILGGVLRIGTPICVPERNNLILGKVSSIEQSHKALNECRQGQVAIKIQPMNNDQAGITVGRHFEVSHQLASWLTRQSIDALKEYFKDEMTMDDWRLVRVLKNSYGIA